MKNKIHYIPLLPEFEKFIRASKTGRRRKADGMRLEPGTVETYIHCQKILERFIKKNGELSLYTGASLNKKVLKERIQYWRKTMCHLYDFLGKSGYSDSYTYATMKIFRAFLRYFSALKGMPDAGLARFRFPALVMTEPIALSLQRVKELFKVTFPNTFCGSRLNLARDIFIMGCFSALRYSDLMRLTWNQINWDRGKYWLETQSRKTKTLSRVMLPVQLISAINRYKHHRRKWIFPRISNVNLNIQLKHLGKYMGWTETVTQWKSKSGRLQLSSTKQFYEFVTTHTARRTAITLMLELGMPEGLVRHVSGHAHNSREFYRYVHVAKCWQERETDKIFSHIFS